MLYHIVYQVYNVWNNNMRYKLNMFFIVCRPLDITLYRALRVKLQRFQIN